MPYTHWMSAASEARARNQRAKARVEAHDADAAPEFFSIAELADAFGLTHRAIRFYESKGLLTPARLNGARIYTRRDRARLHIIVRAKALGYSLDEVRDYLDLYGKQGEGRIRQLEMTVTRSAELISELEAKRDQIDEKLAELKLINRVCREKISKKRQAGTTDDE